MSAALAQLEPHTEGDTWQGIPVIGPILINGAQPGAAAARVQMSLTRVPYAAGGRLLFDSEAGDNVLPITIVDAETWEFQVPPVNYADFTPPKGKYEGYLQITDVNDERITTHKLKLTVEEGRPG